MRKHVPLLALTPLLVLAACSSEDRRAGGTTASEAKALEDAAEMLDERQVPAGSVPSGAPSGPAAKATSAPSPKPTAPAPTS